MTTLRVLTLNCWGVFIPGTVKYRRERIEAIAEDISQQHYDIVVLCEVWLKSDYQRLCKKLIPRMPHSHYFYSGAIGSGVCMFSVHPMIETVFHQFSLNGFAHKPYHGDWFGGKGVGLCKFNVNGLTVNVYGSHFHAEYRRDHDEYLAHRVAQAFQISQFVRLTSEACDLVLLGGDLNVEPVDLGYKLIRTNAHLLDCWLDKKRTSGYEHGNTDEVPSNSFSSPQPGYPDGKRIDYWLYRPSPNKSVSVEECSVIMNKIPGRSYNFSDHEAVLAVLRLETGDSAESAESRDARLSERDNLLGIALTELERGQKQTESDKSFFQVQVLVLSVLLYLLETSGGLVPSAPLLLSLVKLLLIIAIAVCAWTGFIVKRIEVHGLQTVAADVVNLIESSARSKVKPEITEPHVLT
ncbi:sphingomyelin phosphodiesterase 2-like [Haliotis rufescens]|uniref:sphingomyelin phosphodiesterase 2-like n=1 Tax=Haliotis rufescens TaxID=6454 RepID=UPI00201E8FE8|nr:sphingomyelin phosphodiesterase 2-like [Haliotis rufescens]XP_048258433.1 sphingomyelin phosphodiesterase 2-like [Haliotis rufescens]XP_048258434.1 sphingomyelin phosphodiesterase 2-like [Haliotis rufescens]